MATTTTIRAIRRAEFGSVQIASSGGNVEGDIVAVGDGRVGVVSGLSSIDTGDLMTLDTAGAFDILKGTASNTFAVGAPVYYDATAKTAKTTSAAGYLYAGRCVKASANGDVYVYTEINASAIDRVPTQTVAAAGSTQSDAAGLIEGMNVVTGANGTVGVVLPTAAAGMVVMLKGTTSGVLKVWPASGGTINALSPDAAMSLASGVIPAILVATSATQWYTIPLLPS